MKLLFASILLLIPFLAQSAESGKLFNLLPHLDVPEIEGNVPEQACAIQQDLITNLDWIYDTVLPRVQSEVATLLKPQIIENRKIFVAHNVDNADLFHFHIRYPSKLDVTDASAVRDSKNYHLHYHSYEKIDLMRLKWLQEIRALNDSATQVWLEARWNKANEKPSSQVGGFTNSGPDLVKDTEMNAAGVSRLAELWHGQLGERSPGIEYVSMWTEFLNARLVSKSLNELLRYRSVASFDDRFDIIKGLDLPNIWQSADVTYVPVSGNEDLADLVTRFMSENKQKWLINYEGKLAEFLPARENLKATAVDSIKEFQNLVTAKTDKTFILKSSISKVPAFTTAITVQGKFIFVLNYNVYRYSCDGVPKKI